MRSVSQVTYLTSTLLDYRLAWMPSRNTASISLNFLPSLLPIHLRSIYNNSCRVRSMPQGCYVDQRLFLSTSSLYFHHVAHFLGSYNNMKAIKIITRSNTYRVDWIRYTNRVVLTVNRESRCPCSAPFVNNLIPASGSAWKVFFGVSVPPCTSQ